MRIAVLGYIVRGPLGGMAWHHLNYVLGFASLGHDVLFLEDSDDYESCWDPELGMTTDPTRGLAFAGRARPAVGLGDRWAYWDAHAATWHGPRATDVLDWCRDVDVVVNVSAVNPLREWLAGAPRRAYVDTDPAFTQVRHLTDPAARALAEAHTHFLTFGTNAGRAGCTLPDDGLPWEPTRQPVALDAWRATPGDARAPYTTVMQWDAYATREWGGRTFGMKSASFGPYRDLPGRTGETLEIALGGEDAPRDDLRAHGWRLVNPLEAARDVGAYQDYVRRSKGELSVAKAGYVDSRSGWFSERSTGYLASGRPAVVQDTGFTEWLPAGDGLVAFTSPDEALAGLEAIAADYDGHCRAARALAEEHFDARKVLGELLAAVQA